MRTTIRDRVAPPKSQKVERGDSSKKAIADRLYRLRIAKGEISKPPEKITQSEFAKRAGLTQNAYTNYENGTRRPSTPALAALKFTYDVTTDWILFGDDSNMPHGLLERIESVKPKA